MDRNAALQAGAAPPRRSPGQEAAAEIAAQKVLWAGAWLLPLFLASLFIPGSFQVGPINLTAYKLLLLLTVIPLGLHWIRGRAGPVTASDVFVLLFCGWVALSLLILHGPSRITLIGTTFVESFGAYMVTRTLVRSAEDHRAFFKALVCILAAVLPFALYEFVVGDRLWIQIFGSVLSVADFDASYERRLGFRRTMLAFNHPILFGVVLTPFVANMYYVYGDRFLARFRNTGLVVFLLFTSLSSGPMLGAAVQILAIAWDRIVRFIKARWMILVLLAVITLSVLEVVLPGGLIGYLVNEVIFNPYGGANRINIIKFGTAEILRHPILGIGLNDWVRGWWMHPTVDNFWLLTAMRYGLPAFAFLVLGIGVSAYRILTKAGLSEAEERYRTGYLIGLVGLGLVLGTVHIWGAAVPVVMAYIGLGSWFYTSPEARARAAAPVRRPSSAVPERLARPARTRLADRAGAQGRPGTAAAPGTPEPAGRPRPVRPAPTIRRGPPRPGSRP